MREYQGSREGLYQLQLQLPITVRGKKVQSYATFKVLPKHSNLTAYLKFPSTQHKHCPKLSWHSDSTEDDDDDGYTCSRHLATQYFQLYFILSSGLFDVSSTAVSWEEPFTHMDIKFTTLQAKPFLRPFIRFDIKARTCQNQAE